MPIIKSAIKKLRKDKKRTLVNKLKKDTFRNALKKARKHPTEANAKALQILLDKAVKTHLIHKNKASRLKANVSRLISKPKKTTTSVQKKPSKVKKNK